MVTADGTRDAAGDARPAVFYDGSCPLCSAEIDVYRKCRGADGIDWVDVAADGSGDTVAPGLSRADALRRFHMRRDDGTMVSGGAAFAELWASLPALARAGRMARRWPFRVLLDGVYRLFLPLRPGLQTLLRRRRQRRKHGRGSKPAP